MAGAVAVQVAREEVFESCESFQQGAATASCSVRPEAGTQEELNYHQSETRSEMAASEETVALHVTGSEDTATADTLDTGNPAVELGNTAEGPERGPMINTVSRHSRLAPYKPGKMTVVLDMDECLLHSKFHGPGAASEAYRQCEERPDAVNEVNSFWVALDDGDTAQVNKRPGLDPFLEALAKDYNTIVFTAAMPDYAGPVLDYIDPKGTLFHQRLYRSSCRQVKGAFLKDLSVLGLESTDMTRTVLVDNNPLSFICQPTNGVLVASFYDDPNDTALASVMQLIRHLDHAGDVRPILKDMFRLDTLLAEYRNALFDDEDAEIEASESHESVLEYASGEGESEKDAPAQSTGLASLSPVEQTLIQEEKSVQGTPARRGDSGEDVREECASSDAPLKDDDDESVKTEACSEESGESSLGEPSASREEMELDLEF